MRDRTRFSFLIAAFLLSSACGDDPKHRAVKDDSGEVTGEVEGGVPGTEMDGGLAVEMDASTSIPDSSLDGASPDGSLPDASPLDASGSCDVNDPRYGCGTRSGTTWISFPDFEVDVANKVAWTKPATVVDDDDLAAICPALTSGGLTWELPQMDDVRQLAAGCDKTVPGGSCLVDVDQVKPEEAGDCDCPDGLVGPHEGKFCRPEVPDCEVLWVWTHTNDTNPYDHWFYDPDTGDIVPQLVGVEIATRAKGRCVHALADGELPMFITPVQ